MKFQECVTATLSFSEQIILECVRFANKLQKLRFERQKRESEND